MGSHTFRVHQDLLLQYKYGRFVYSSSFIPLLVRFFILKRMLRLDFVKIPGRQKPANRLTISLYWYFCTTLPFWLSMLYSQWDDWQGHNTEQISLLLGRAGYWYLPCSHAFRLLLTIWLRWPFSHIRSTALQRFRMADRRDNPTTERVVRYPRVDSQD